MEINSDQILLGRLLFWVGALLFAACLLPNHYLPWLSIHQELGAALAFAPLLIWASIQTRWVPGLAWAVMAFSLVPVVQLMAGQLSFSSDGWMASLYLLNFALAIHAGARCAVQSGADPKTSFGALTWPWAGLLAAALISVGIEIYQWLSMGNGGIYVAEVPPRLRPFGNLAQPNQMATLLLIGCSGLMFFWEMRKLRAGIAICAALLLECGLVITGSRTVLLALIWLVPGFFLLRRRCGLRTSPLAMIGLVSSFLLLSFCWPWINELLLLSLDGNSAIERINTTPIRLLFWRSMLDAIAIAPWFGYGWGQIGSAQTLTTLDFIPAHLFFESSHNLFLDLALWVGLPLAVLAVAILCAWFAWQVYRCRDALSFTVLMAVLVVFNHAMVEFPLNYAYFLLPVGLWMGTLCAVNPWSLDIISPGKSLPFIRALIGLAAGSALVLFVMMAIDYFPLEEDWRLMRLQEARVGNFEPTEAPPVLLLNGLREFLRFSRTEARPGMSPAEIDWMRRVSERYAYAAPMFKYALAQALNGSSAGADLTLRRLCSIQSIGECKRARRDWIEVTKTRYPQLINTPFPEVEDRTY